MTHLTGITGNTEKKSPVDLAADPTRSIFLSTPKMILHINQSSSVRKKQDVWK